MILFGLTGPAHADKLSVWQTLKHVKKQLQIYRGDRAERLFDRFAVGRTTFDKRLSVADNLRALGHEPGMRLSKTTINHRDIPVLEIELGGKHSTNAIRKLHKKPTQANPYGHVAVRPGVGGIYDMTGTRGLYELPWLARAALKLVHGGDGNVSTARKRNPRRFLESRKDQKSTDIYVGMLFAASAEESSALQALYNTRRNEVTEFSVSGGDADKGVYSCAQFLTHQAPFLNQRGINRTVSAKGMAGDGFRSVALEGMVVYRMPQAPEGTPSVP